jgi:predicted O-linked N-acetylglucosamine transferase (SPINDLY family)
MSRVAFLPFMARADYMALLAASDVILDTPHFSGGGTTLDAIATATPVVTLAGPTLRSSQTRALFERMGVRDGISVDGADYVRQAIDMASRSDLRADMAQRIRQSSGLLFEDVGMVREVEALFRRWVADAPR